MAEDQILELIERKDMSRRDRICLTVSQQEFDLKHWHLKGLDCTEEENPHGSSLAPQKTYSVWDVAAKAIEINGPTGENKQLRQQRAEEEQEHAAKAAKVAADQAGTAEAFVPKSPVEKLCKELGVAPWSKLTKKRTLDTFNLDWMELQGLGVPFESRPNPRNPSWNRMCVLYKAEDVAQALVKKRKRTA